MDDGATHDAWEFGIDEIPEEMPVRIRSLLLADIEAVAVRDRATEQWFVLPRADFLELYEWL